MDSLAAFVSKVNKVTLIRYGIVDCPTSTEHTPISDYLMPTMDLQLDFPQSKFNFLINFQLKLNNEEFVPVWAQLN